MPDRLPHVRSFALEHPWALTATHRAIVATILARRAVGLETDPDVLLALRDRAQTPGPAPRAGAGIAIIPVHGVLVPRASLFSDVSGLTSLDDVAAAVLEAATDPKVSQIVLDVDSPGGSVAGCLECAATIRDVRGSVPVIAHARYLMCSAAYWLASQATEIVASPSAEIGSIGVYAIHDDLSDAYKQLGIVRTYIFRGDHKIDGNEAQPLSDDARAEIDARVERYYAAFVDDVARGRGVTSAAVRAGFGQGRAVGADDARALGMVDRVATFDALVASLETSPPRGRFAAAAPRVDVDALWANDAYRDICALNLES